MTVGVFDEIAAELDYPVYVVTVSANGQRDGCLVGFASQCSIHPARFAVWLSVENRTYRLARCADALGVHLLGREDTELARLFGGETGDEVDKLARCAWRDGASGVPVLEDAPAWFAGRILERVEPAGADHVAFVLDPLDGELRRRVPLLTFQDVKEIEPGHPA
jgi:flavin reductase (DIM6/NTAB) family NADH-FMN oxidoreductase RutF